MKKRRGCVSVCFSRLKNFFVSPAPASSLEAMPDNPTQPSIFNRIGTLYTSAKKITAPIRKYTLPVYASVFRAVANPATCIFYTAYVAGYFNHEEESELVGGLLALAVVNVTCNALMQSLRVAAIFRKHFGTKAKRKELKAKKFSNCQEGSMLTSYYTVIFSGYSNNVFSGLTYLYSFVLFLKSIEKFANDDPNRTALVAVNSIFGLLSMGACLLAYSAYTVEAIKDNVILVLNTLADDDWQLNINHFKAFSICIFGAISHPCLLYDTVRASLHNIPFINFSPSFVNTVAGLQIPFVIISDLFSTFVATYQYFGSRHESTPELTGFLKAALYALIVAIIFDSIMTGLSHFTAVAKKADDPYGVGAIILATCCGLSAAFRNGLFSGYYGIEQVKAHDLPILFPNQYRLIRDTSLVEAPHQEPEEKKENNLENGNNEAIELLPRKANKSVSDAKNRHALFSHQYDTRSPVIINPSVLDIDLHLVAQNNS